MKKALITGIYGQDGSFLYEYLYKKGYEVYGLANRTMSQNSIRIKTELLKKGMKPIVYSIDLTNKDEMENLLESLQVNEIYHLSASHVSSEGRKSGNLVDENSIFKNNVINTANILAACYEVLPDCKILTAGSCLMFDASSSKRQNEDTVFESNSLYGIGKITENQLVKYYRNKGLFACTAILYNHESHRRSVDFVTRKIVKNMCEIKRNPNHQFKLGSIDIEKDWGAVQDYVRGMYKMLQAETPKDYILSSNELHTIREFVELCAKKLEIENWEKNIILDENEVAYRKNRTTLFGDSSMIEKELGWKRTMTLQDIIEEMIERENG